MVFKLLIRSHPIFLSLERIIIIFIEACIMFIELPRSTHRATNNISTKLLFLVFKVSRMSGITF